MATSPVWDRPCRSTLTGSPTTRPRNEQGMVHTASAFAKMRNRLSALACTSSIGPGATNMITGAALATINRLPVLLLPGDIFASRWPDPVLQQLEAPHDARACQDYVSDFVERFADAYREEMEHFVRAVCSGEDPGVGGGDAAAAFVLVQAPERSYRESKTVRLKSETRDGTVFYEEAD